MSVSTDWSSTPADYLLRELARLRGENRRLRRRVAWLRESRADWKRRARARLEGPLGLPVGDPRHGTENGYGNLGCRCDECRAAHNAYCLAYQHRAGRHRPHDEYVAERWATLPPHGTETRYTGRGCRCDECKQAASKARNRRRYSTPEKAERQRARDREYKRAKRARLRDPLVSKARQPLTEQERMKAGAG